VVRHTSFSASILQAGLLLPDGRTVELFDVHPRRPLYRNVGPVPVALDTRDRDEDVAVVAAAVASLEDPQSALVVGDLNGTWTEPGLEPLRRLLTDAHEVAGTGPGFTWRPHLVETLGIGVLRIDHVLTGGSLRPIGTTLDCEATGDHCRLLVRLAAPLTAAPSSS
jgi:endonuclease/exonuclease/phosphatase (EEP) superfamily protein YafD